MKYLVQIICLIGACAGAICSDADPEISISAESVPDLPRQRRIRWIAPTDSEVYIGNLDGVDAASGEKIVEPDTTCAYTLFVQTKFGLFQKSVTVNVEGKKGSEDIDILDF